MLIMMVRQQVKCSMVMMTLILEMIKLKVKIIIR